MVARTGPARTDAWTGVGWLSRRWLRRRWPAMVPIALIVAAGTAGSAIALSTADRTANAYADYRQRADVGDLVINPGTSTREIDEVIRTLPGVRLVTSDTTFVTTLDDGRPRSRAEVGYVGSEIFVRGSSDGRYTEMDRPAVQSGRMPANASEAVVSADAARSQGLAIGDTVTLAFWQPQLADDLGATVEIGYAAEVIDPIGVEDLEIVGVVTLPGQVLPDELFPRADMIVAPDLASRYDCLPDPPVPGATVAEALATLLPSDCALSYRYYSLAFSDGAAGVKPALDDFLDRAGPLNASLGDISGLEEAGADGPAYFLIPTESVLEVRRVGRAVQPIVAALVVLGLAAAAVTVVLVALAVTRELRRSQQDQQQWRELAVGTGGRAMVVGLPAVVAIFAGLVVGVAAGYLVASGPIGQVQAIEPDADRRLDLPIVGSALAIALLAVVVNAVLALRSAGRTPSSSGAPAMTRAARSVPTTIGSPAIADGLRAAIGPRAALPVIAGSALIGGALVAAVVFSSSLTNLVGAPRAYGWPWDMATMTGFGYGGLDVERAHQLLDGDAEVETWTVLGFYNELLLDGQPTLALLAPDAQAELDLSLLSGTIPTAADQIAVGASTANDLGLGVGDSVELSDAEFGPTSVTVSGIVVFRSLGPFAADRVGAGTGVLLPSALLETVEEAEGDALSLATFIGVDLRDDADPNALGRIEQQLGSLDLSGTNPVAYGQPVRPPELVEFRSTQAVPVIVVIVLAVMATAGLLFASWASARARRRELAVLRSLGFTAAQVRRSVRVQSATTVVAALVIGVPLGVIAGRLLWRGFADQLGVVPDPASAWLPLLIVVVSGLLAAIAVAQVPAVLAARRRPSEGLRAE